MIWTQPSGPLCLWQCLLLWWTALLHTSQMFLLLCGIEGSNKYWLHRFRLLQEFHFYWFWSEEKEAISQKDHCNRSLPFSVFIIDTCSLHWLIIWNRSRDCCDIWSGASNLLTELKQKVALIGRWKPPKQKPPMEQCWYIHQQRNTIVSHLCPTFLLLSNWFLPPISTCVLSSERMGQNIGICLPKKNDELRWDKILNRPHLS